MSVHGAAAGAGAPYGAAGAAGAGAGGSVNGSFVQHSVQSSQQPAAVTLQSGPVQLAFPLPKQNGAAPLSPSQAAHMLVRPVTAPTGLVRLAAQLSASTVGLQASAEASGVLKSALKACKTQIALRKLQTAATRNACEKVHADCVALDARCRAAAQELQAQALIATDLEREQQRLQQRKAQRAFEIAQIAREIERENEAVEQLNALAAKMRTELSRLTKERDHYQRESQIAERNATRLRAAVADKAASTKRLFAAFDVSERDLGVAGGSSTALVPASGGGLQPSASVTALMPAAAADQSVPSFLR